VHTAQDYMDLGGRIHTYCLLVNCHLTNYDFSSRLITSHDYVRSESGLSLFFSSRYIQYEDIYCSWFTGNDYKFKSRFFGEYYLFKPTRSPRPQIRKNKKSLAL